MAKGNKIIENDIIENEVYQIGQKFGKSLDPANKAIEQFEKNWITSIEQIKRASLDYTKISKEFSKVGNSKEFLATKKQEEQVSLLAAKAYAAENQALINLQKVETEKSRTEKENLIIANKKLDLDRKQEAETKKKITLTAQEKYEIQQLNKGAREAALLSSALSTEYEKQSLRLTLLRAKYKDVALIQGVSSKEAKTLASEITKLDTKLKEVDANAGQFQRNVGNYGSAMKSAGAAARSMASAMGVVGGAVLFATVVKDAFNRVREFDKSMQNLAGVLRTTRSELAPLETRIISVAGASIKTSREIAELAETLATLGKSPEQIEKLLKPVDDLSIGLNTTGAEAGEFLIQMLNAFGASDDEAGKYADTIASIANSTSLDFIKMRDSFQYIAPISRLLNKDLAYTGAVVGILADNGLKAESSGRLLATGIQKLSKSGLTLNDALNQINEAQSKGIKETELLKIANGLLGAEGAKVGIILAANTGIIEKNAQAIRDNGGALEDLVTQQLESVDAKIKTLDSTYEELILSIENGKGTLSSAFVVFLDIITQSLKKLIEFNSTYEDLRAKQAGISFSADSKIYEGLDPERKKAIAEQNKLAAQWEISSLNDELKKASADIKKYDKISFGNLFNTSKLKEARKSMDSINLALGVEKGRVQAADAALSSLNKTTENTVKTNNTVTEETKEQAKAREKANKEREKDEKALKDRLKQLAEDAYNYQKSLIEREINDNKDILDDEKSTLLEKQIANINYTNAKISLLDLTKAKEIKDNSVIVNGKEQNVDKLKTIDEKYSQDLYAIQKIRQANGLELLKEQFEAELKLVKDAEQKKQDAENQEIKGAQDTLSSSARTPKDIEAYEKAVYEIKKKYALLRIQVQIDEIKALQADKTHSVEQQAELAKQLSVLEIAYSNVSTDQIIEDSKKEFEEQKKNIEALEEIRKKAFQGLIDGLAGALDIDSSGLNDFFNVFEGGIKKLTDGLDETGITTADILQGIGAAAQVTSDIIGAVHQANIEELERQKEASNEYYDNAFERAEGDKIQQDLIREEQKLKEDELNKKIAKEKTKAAKAEKAAAIVQAGINTALAVTAALATVPFLPLGLAMSIVAGAMGLAQIGIIASKPIPKFKDGHLSGTHEGLALTNDGGRDEVWERDGKAQVIKGRNVPIMMKKKDKIYKSVDDYKKLMRASILASVDIDNNKLKSFQAEQAFLNASNKIDEKAIEEAISNGFRKQRVNFHTTNNNKVDLNYPLWRIRNLDRN
ncbi:phage tail tape measure protein [Flavobacterium sp. GT3P67]|uniref:phage tail tape measure protein n=1 Tax=Flavobacterium sp. GT3P67 TaxID=2541722 RepID=UPI001049FC6B|nr:phage tail tape measure protein [Flavobacterium sp. GT3P67]TDE53756.1 phage tail tape measure protein [Flavobacterium sp. GT3P67]